MVELGIQGILQRTIRLHSGVAGARGAGIASPGSRNFADLFRRRPARAAPSALRSRGRLAFALAAVAFVAAANAQVQVLSSRIWPAPDYTRLTLESSAEIKYSVFSVKGPERLGLDLGAGGRGAGG